MELKMFGVLQQLCGTLAHLADRAGRRVEGVGGDGLYGVDDEDAGLDSLDVLEDAFEACLADDEDVVGAAADAVGAHFYLRGALFAGDVEDGALHLCDAVAGKEYLGNLIPVHAVFSENQTLATQNSVFAFCTQIAKLSIRHFR